MILTIEEDGEVNYTVRQRNDVPLCIHFTPNRTRLTFELPVCVLTCCAVQTFIRHPDRYKMWLVNQTVRTLELIPEYEQGGVPIRPFPSRPGVSNRPAPIRPDDDT